MPLIQPLPAPVPFEEVAAVLADAAARVSGGPPALVTASGRQLAAALETAGFRVVRDAKHDGQFTL
jgi:thiamine pyrophosphate-dependent acetolactate synthase large subunit-like protein